MIYIIYYNDIFIILYIYNFSVIHDNNLYHFSLIMIF